MGSDREKGQFPGLDNTRQKELLPLIRKFMDPETSQIPFLALTRQRILNDGFDLIFNYQLKRPGLLFNKFPKRGFVGNNHD